MSIEKQQQPESKEVHVSEYDERQYRYITLSNELECLLIHDAETDKAGAAMDVKVGQFNDPAHALGIAHFLEHMLFLGTSKYPDESSYNAFLNSHGGESNAFTDFEDTCYFFEVNQEHLEGVLDMFSQFFIAPLFTESATDREMNAVDSENSKNLQSDAWRTIQLYKSLVSKEHPFHQFGTGNLQTLKDNPIKAGVDIRSELLKFHKTFYSSNIMRLSVLGRHSLDELEIMVRERFEEVENKSVSPPKVGGRGLPCSPDMLGKRLQVVPVKDLRQVQCTWLVPSTQPYWQTKPMSYISHLIGHEGKGSLLSLLKARGLVNDLSAGEYYTTSDFTVFMVSMDCTDLGMKKVDEVVMALFSYIEEVKAASMETHKLMWQEVSDVAEMNWRFASKSPASSYVQRIVMSMQHFPADKCLSGPRLYTKFDEALLKEHFAYLAPSQMFLVEHNKAFLTGEEASKLVEEEWYGTKYIASDIDKDKMKAWSSPVKEETLHLPEVNPMIATDFTLKSGLTMGGDEEPSVEELHRQPVLLRDDGHRLWFKQDRFFRKPKICVRVALTTPVVYESPESAILSELLTNSLLELLNEENYLAEQAGLHTDVYLTKTGLCLDFTGYSHKMPVLVERVMRQVALLPEVDDNDMLERLKDKLEKSLINQLFGQPYQLAISASQIAMDLPKWSASEKLGAVRLPSVTQEAVRLHAKRAFRQMQVEALVHGNATEQDATALLEIVLSCLKQTTMLPAVLTPEARSLCLSPGTSYEYSLKAFNEEEPCSAVEVLYQVGPETIPLGAKVHLLMHLMKDKAFDELRTVQQLGYIVFSGTVAQSNYIVGGRLIVMSATAPPEVVEERIEAFLKGFSSTLADMSKEEFDKNVKAVVDNLTQKLKSLGEEDAKLWKEISIQRYQFDRNAQLAVAVQELTLQDVVEIFQTHFLSSQRRKFTSRVFGCEHPMEGGQLGLGSGEGKEEDKDTAEVKLEQLKLEEVEVERLTVNGVGVQEVVVEETLLCEGGVIVKEDGAKVVVVDPVVFKRSMPLHPQRVVPRVSMISSSKL